MKRFILTTTCLRRPPHLARITRAIHKSPVMDVVIEPDTESLKVTSHHQYNAADSLGPKNVLPSPLDQFRVWFTEAQGKVKEPEAMSVSTATAAGVPSSRFVLLRTVDQHGFVFFTSYESRKSKEISENPYAALAFYWGEVHRQVRVVGKVEKVSEEESAAYYRSRPLESRQGAWASPQSSVIQEGELAERLSAVKERFGQSDDIPLPPFWGGWRIVPHEVEFWAGKPSRLHDRVRYTRSQSDSEDPWKIDKIAP